MILLQHIIILSIKIKQKYNFKKLYVTFVQGFGKVVIMNPCTHWPVAMFCKDYNEYIISLIKVI